MLSNFSWLEYGTFIGVCLLFYYAVVIALFYRKEVMARFAALGSRGVGAGSRLVSDSGAVDMVDRLSDGADLLGKPALEDGATSVSMDDLDFGSNDALLQGELADCMAELGDTFCLALDKSWDKKKLFASLSEIAECYSGVFASPLRAQVLEYITLEVDEKLGIGFSAEELEGVLSVRVPGWRKVVAGGASVLAFAALVFGVGSVDAYAQDGNQGIAEATNKVAGYFDTGTDLMYAIGAIMGLVGAVKVYSKWNAGEPDTAKVATAWFGSCIFLVVVATVLKSFFGI